MKAVDDLQHEHRVIELVLTGLEWLARRAQSEQRLNRERAERALEVLRNFADRCHHGKEERHLFRMMEARGMSRESGPLGVMLHEHTLGREHIRAMVEALPRAAEGEAAALAAFADRARAYAELLRQHIRKEDSVLYPMAKRLLSEDDAQRLLTDFEAVERDEMGEGAHDKYHRWAHELAEGGE